MKVSERGRAFLAQGAAWLLLAGGLAAAGATLALQTQDCLAYGDEQSSADLPVGVLLAGVAFAGIGRLLTARRPENRISWLITWLGFSLPVIQLLTVYTDCAVYGALALPGAALVAWLAPYFGLFVIVPLFVLLPAWFPDGRFMSGGWARLLWTLSAAAAALSVAASLLPGNMISGFSGEVPIENPFGLPGRCLSNSDRCGSPGRR